MVDCATASSGGEGQRVPSFIESAFTTKVEYNAWVAAGAQAQAAADVAARTSSTGDSRIVSADACAAEADAEVGRPVQREAREAEQREAEMHAVHVALAEQLDGAVPPEPDVIDSLLSRLQELSTAPGAAAAADLSLGADESDERKRRAFELVHPGTASAEAMEELEAVLAAVTAWCFDPEAFARITEMQN